MSGIGSEKTEILKRFRLDAQAVSLDLFGRGRINHTELVRTASGRRYVLQRISDTAFSDVPDLMKNIVNVTGWLREKGRSGMRVLTLVPTVQGEMYAETDGEYWRVYEYIEDSICLQEPRSERDLYEAARGFAMFSADIAELPAEALRETQPGFHDTPDRYRVFKEVLASDPLGRGAGLARETDLLLEREDSMKTLMTLKNEGVLPVRITHGDTKLNNMLLDAVTGKPLCVIDLDTVMPGLSLWDIGDAVRSGAAVRGTNGAEKDVMSLSLFEAFACGWLECFRGLRREETELIPKAVITMTVECALRYLTDYLEGDRYFVQSRPGQNLDRARTLLRLSADMEAKENAMYSVVRRRR